MTPINCLDCVHVVSIGAIKHCQAPQLDALNDDCDNTLIQCLCVRAFRHACGHEARWFVKRVGMRYSYSCDCWKNNGQGCEAHDPQLRLPVQSIGESQA